MNFQGDVICTCPDSPISAENDFYPHPPNITNATTQPAAAQATAQSIHPQRRARRAVLLDSMTLPNYPAQPFSPLARTGFTYDQLAPSGLAYKWAAPAPRFAGPAVFSPAGRRGPQGLWIGAPPPMNPPDGDYPVTSWLWPLPIPSHPPPCPVVRRFARPSRSLPRAGPA